MASMSVLFRPVACAVAVAVLLPAILTLSACRATSEPTVAAEEIRASWPPGVTSASAAVLDLVADPRAFGAKGDGVADDGPAIAAALATKRPVHFAAGRYRITSEIVVPAGAVMRGAGIRFWQSADRKPDGSGATLLVFDGPVAVNSTVLRLSGSPVSVRPQWTADGRDDTFSVSLSDLIVDANGKADFAIYCARCGLGTMVQRVIATGANYAGVYASELWSSTWSESFAIFNRGSGFVFGRNIFGWQGSVVNANLFQRLTAYQNGLAGAHSSLAPTIDHDRTNPLYLGAGFVFDLYRANTIDTIQAEMNDGVGVIVQGHSGGNILRSLYVEDNSTLDISGTGSAVARGATNNGKAWGLWIAPWRESGTDTPTTWALLVDGAFFHYQDSLRRQSLRILGQSNLNDAGFADFADSAPLLLRGITGGADLESAARVYRLESVSPGGQARITQALPELGMPGSISETSVSTLYVRTGGAGVMSGRTAGDAMANLASAVRTAMVVSSVKTIDVTGMDLTAQSLSSLPAGKLLTINGGGTARLVQSASGNALTVANNLTALILTDFAVIEKCAFTNANIEIHNATIKPVGGDTAAAITVSGGSLRLVSSSIDLTGKTAGRRGLEVKNRALVSTEASNISGYEAGLAVLLRDGGGHVSTDAAATWLGDIFWESGQGQVTTPTAIYLSGAVK